LRKPQKSIVISKQVGSPYLLFTRMVIAN